MASAFAHAFAAASLGFAMTPERPRARLLLAGVACSILPDADVVGFAFGVPYGDLLGHRGLTHSFVFAALVAAFVCGLFFRDPPWAGQRLRVLLYLFLATASHGVFDALTNGGLGVAFLAPFDAARWFFPFRPVVVSPIGIAEFFTARSLAVLWSELLWIVLPWSALCVGVFFLTRGIRSKHA